MNYSEKVEWLRRYRAALKKEKLLRDELQALWERSIGCGQALNGMPRAASDGQSLPRAVESIDRARRELECQIDICCAIQREIVTAIESVLDERDQEILRRRYLLGEKWYQIGMELPMNERGVRKRARRAVENMQIG